MSPTLPLDLNYRPTLPKRKDWRIGCIGAGFIMRDCHLVAYRNAGFNPVAIASRNAAAAREVAARHAIPTVHETIEAVLADPQRRNPRRGRAARCPAGPDPPRCRTRQRATQGDSRAETARAFRPRREGPRQSLRRGGDRVRGQPEHARTTSRCGPRRTCSIAAGSARSSSRPSTCARSRTGCPGPRGCRRSRPS